MPGSSYGNCSGSTCRPSNGLKLYDPPRATDSFVNDTLKSKLNSLGADEAHGKLQPIRSRYASSLSSDARDTAVNATSWFCRCSCTSSIPSARAEQLGQPSSQSGPYMKWYTTNCERPWKRSASEASPSSVSNR